MSAKLIYSLTEENQDFHKQISCMNGIFQLFDRRHFLSGRRSNQKRLPPVVKSGNDDDKQKNGVLHKAKDKNPKKMAKEKHRTSTESSRTSFSSSSCSSSTFSSLDCNKVSQSEPSSVSQTISNENPSKSFPINQTKQSLDLRDVVKDSINRETRVLSVNIANKESTGHTLKHIDSPRPVQFSKSAKPRVSNFTESSRIDNRLFAPKDAPRFSYDGRESREKSTIKIKEIPRLSLDSRAGSMKNQMEFSNNRKFFTSCEDLGSYKQQSSVVAKLMGLDPLPNSTVQNQDLEPLNQNRVSGSPRNHQQGTISPSLRNTKLGSKAESGLKIPIEKPLDSPVKAPISCPSVYGEIEKRLADLEFRKSGKDLRALKQILEAMQKTKETLDTKQGHFSKMNQTCDDVPRSNLANQKKFQEKTNITSKIRPTSPLKNSGSPIVIMKPATLLRKSNNEGLTGLHKLRTRDSTETRDIKENLRGSSNLSPRIRTQTSKVPAQQIDVESPSSSGRSTAALSPRLQRKQVALETQPRPTTSPSDSSRARKKLSKPLIESNSPGRKIRPRSPNLQNNEQLSEINIKTRCLSQHGNDADSLQFEEVIISSFPQQAGQKHRNQVARWDEEESITCLPIITPQEQPSPVSVLDAMFYKDDLPSPVKKISHDFEDYGVLNSDELVWPTADHDQHHISDNIGSKASFYHTNSENIEQLVHKLNQLNSPKIENSIDYTTPVIEHGNKDHKYISEILLASGVLSRNLAPCLMNIQLKSTGHFLNPDLFFVLEQTYTKTVLNNEPADKISNQKTHRKLIFDTVDELLLSKLVSTGSNEPWISQTKTSKRILNGQILLEELCLQISQLQAYNSEDSLQDDGDIFRSILMEDLKKQSPNWIDLGNDVSALVLDIERLIFKDLVTEVVDGEATSLGTRVGGHCRKLFAK